MRKFLLSVILAICTIVPTYAQWASVNFDKATTAAMTAGYETQLLTEGLVDSELMKILKHYESSEVAVAGIFLTKALDRKALQNAGRFGSREENYYYHRIRKLVENKIMPKIVTVATLCIKRPDKALYWGPYLFKVCEDVKNLCMLFQTVVCNNKLSFQDIVFYTISDSIKPLFNLIELGSVNYEELFNRLTDFDGITMDDIKHDFNSLLDIGAAIAAAGGETLSESLAKPTGALGNAFSGRINDLINLYSTFKESYAYFSDPMNVKNEILARLGTTEEDGVMGLLSRGDYNIAKYISDYVDKLEGRYYKQRYYIYYEDSGSEELAMWYPTGQPGDGSVSMSQLDDGTYYRRPYSDSYDYADYENARIIAQNRSGWTESYINNLQRNDPKKTYSLTYPDWYYYHSWRGSEDNKINKYIGCSLRAYRYWNIREEVYEETFDSYDMSLQAFLAKMNGKVAEFNENQDVEQPNGVWKEPEKKITYYLGSDPKLYYSESDERKMKGCAKVTYSQACSGTNDMTQGTFSWKVNQEHNHDDVRDDSRRYAMETTLPTASPETAEFDEQINTLEREVVSLQAQISNLEKRQNDLYKLINSSMTPAEEKAGYRAEYNSNDVTLQNLKRDLSSKQNTLNELKNHRDEMMEDYASTTDDVVRIPSVMHEVESAFHITWTNSGSWSGDVFTRNGTLSNNLDAEVVFTAKLECTRGESRFLGIRYHRAILKVTWDLKSNYSGKTVIETMELDPEASDTEKSEKANKRLHELQREYPDCTIEMEYAYLEPQKAEEPDVDLHLLWVSDRLRIARDIEYRLAKIYTHLMLTEKFMRRSDGILEYLKDAVFKGIPTGGKKKFGSKSMRRWQTAALHVAAGREPKEVEFTDEEASLW